MICFILKDVINIPLVFIDPLISYDELILWIHNNSNIFSSFIIILFDHLTVKSSPCYKIYFIILCYSKNRLGMMKLCLTD